MATFTGTSADDTITPSFVSPGVNPPGTFPGDAFDSINGSVGNDIIDGGGGPDDLTGSLGNDTIFGGSGVDIVRWFAGHGSDLVDGGTGFDTAEFDGNGVAEQVDIVASGSHAHFVYNAGAADVDLSGIELIRFHARAGADKITIGDLTGTDVVQVVIGFSQTSGGGAPDTSADQVVVNGGAGADKIDLFESASAFVVNGLAVQVVVIAASIVNDSEPTNDLIVVDGGLGDDEIDASAAAAFSLELRGGAGFDTISYVAATSAVSIDLASGLTGTPHLLNGFENVRGSAFADVLSGNEAGNVIDGGRGGDTMAGRAGNDLYIVDHFEDVVDEAQFGSDGLDTVLSSIDFSLSDGAHALGIIENLTLTGAAVIGVGNGVANVLVGNGLANVLNGLDGDDTLSGGAGLDTLTGGAGADRFLFDTPLDAATNLDIVADFAIAEDTILLENAVFAKLTKEGALKKKYFEVGKKADDKDDFILLNKKTGVLSYDADGSKKKFDAIAFADLEDGLKLTADDFLVV